MTDLWSEHPEWDDDSKESKDVQEQNQGLKQREVFGTDGVEEQREDSNSHCHQSSLPRPRELNQYEPNRIAYWGLPRRTMRLQRSLGS